MAADLCLFDTPINIPFVIGISGKKRSGKDTVANMLTECFDRDNTALANPQSVTRYSMAQKLKDVLMIMGYTFEQLNGNEKESSCQHSSGLTPRQAMQNVGMFFRQHGNYWLNCFVDKLRDINDTSNSVVIVSDIRFEDEANFIKNAWGIRIHLVTNQREGKAPLAAGAACTDKLYDQHISENSIDVSGADYIIDNNGTLDNLKKNVERLFDKIVDDRKRLLSSYKKHDDI